MEWAAGATIRRGHKVPLPQPNVELPEVILPASYAAMPCVCVDALLPRTRRRGGLLNSRNQGTLLILAQSKCYRQRTRGDSLLHPSAPLNILGALKEQFALSGILCERRRALELGACLLEPAKPGKQIATYTRQEVVVYQRRLRG